MTITTKTFSFPIPKEFTPGYSGARQLEAIVTYEQTDCSDLTNMKSVQLPPVAIIWLTDGHKLYLEIEGAIRNNSSYVPEEKAEIDEKWENLKRATNY